MLRTALANKSVLENLKVSLEHKGLPVQSGMNLEQLARLGVQDPSISWPVFQALWKELTTVEGRPPILVTVDGLAHWMKDSNYRSADFKPIHAFDLVFVRHFISLLQPGRTSPALPNGGLLLYATSGSNSPSVYSFQIGLSQLEARKKGVNPSSPEYPQPNPYVKTDSRVLDVFAPAKPTNPKEGALELDTLGGLSRHEARGYMEYFARSGLLPERITDEWVSEKWTLAGGGIIGEMERLGRRVRAMV